MRLEQLEWNRMKKTRSLTFSICLFHRLINGGAYIRKNIFVGKWMGLYPGGGLKTGGALKWDFTVLQTEDLS